MSITHRVGIAVVLLLVVGGGIYGWLQTEREQPVVVITAASHIKAEQGLPVYAQFVVTQTLRVAEMVKISRLVIPLQQPTPAVAPLVIDLLHEGRVQQRWDYQGVTGETPQEVSFALDPPVVLAGDLAVVFSAPSVPPEQRALAPRIFTEPAGYYYPEGSYRIADNEKSGDVALTLVGQYSRGSLLAQHWRTKPLVAKLVTIGRGLTTVLVLVSVPYAVMVRRSFAALARLKTVAS